MRRKIPIFILLCITLCSIALVLQVNQASASTEITWNTIKVNKPTTKTLYGITWGNNAFIAVGYNGTILKSTDGNVWEQKVSGTNIALNDVIWDGTQYIAVGDSGMILSSSNGDSWTSKSSGITNKLNGIAWNGTQLVAVGDNGTIITSGDGDSWVQRTSGVTNNLNAVTWENNCFLVSESKGALISTNGIEWSFKAPNPGELGVVEFHDAIWDGKSFVSVGSRSTIASSSDCINWKYNCYGNDCCFLGIVYNGTKYVSVGSNGYVYISTDGVSWSGNNSSTRNSLYDVVWNGSKFVAVGSAGTIIQSDDGESWFTYYEPGSGYLRDIVYNGSKFVAVGTSKICVSSDGENWFSINNDWLDLYSVTWGNGLFVAVGKEGRIKTSPDGIHWTYQRSGTSKTLKRVFWQGTQFIAVGASGTILTSADGITWTSVVSGLTDNLNDIVYSLGQYIVVGESDCIATSQDGLVWIKQKILGNSYPSNDSYSFNAITYNDNQYIAVGRYGIILTSPDGITWTKRESGTYQELFDIVWNGNLFVTCGLMETTCVSRDGIVWASSNESVSNHFSSVVWGKNKLIAVGDMDSIKYATGQLYIASIPSVNISTTAGTAPVLPAEVTVQYNDNTTTNLPVTWDLIDSAQYEKAGTFTVKGTVNGTINQATANVTVNPPKISVTGVTLDNRALKLTAGGGTVTLTAAVAPDNATNKAVIWSSSNENVATVANGIVTPVASGTAIIMVTTVDGNKTSSCTLEVSTPNFITGDVDGSSSVDALDFALLKKYILGEITSFNYEYGMQAADVNSDGSIDAADLALVKMYLLGKISSFQFIS